MFRGRVDGAARPAHRDRAGPAARDAGRPCGRPRRPHHRAGRRDATVAGRARVGRAARARPLRSRRATASSSSRSLVFAFCALTAENFLLPVQPAQHPHPDLGRRRGCDRRDRRAARGRHRPVGGRRGAPRRRSSSATSPSDRGMPLPLAIARRHPRHDARRGPVRHPRGGRPRRGHPRDPGHAAALGGGGQARPRTRLDHRRRRLLRGARPRPGRPQPAGDRARSSSC